MCSFRIRYVHPNEKKNRKYIMFLLFTKGLRDRIWPAGYSLETPDLTDNKQVFLLLICKIQVSRELKNGQTLAVKYHMKDMKWHVTILRCTVTALSCCITNVRWRCCTHLLHISRSLFCGRLLATTGRTQSNAHFHGEKVSCWKFSSLFRGFALLTYFFCIAKRCLKRSTRSLFAPGCVY